MLLNEFQAKTKNYHKGTFIKASWKSEKVVNGVKCEKVSNGVVRFVNYENMKTTKAKRQNGMQPRQASNGVKVIIEDMVIQASNGNMLVTMKTTKVKTQSTYKINGVAVDKATYQAMVKPSSYNDSGTFTVKLENLISLGK